MAEQITRAEANAFLKRIAAGDPSRDYRLVSAKDAEGPGFVIERRPAGKQRGEWSFVGWAEDVKENSKGALFCYGDRL